MSYLGIPTALDRTIQHAIAQPITDIYEEIFSDYSYGFRPNRSCDDAIKQALVYLNNGYEWVIDIDIEQFFDKVNHDKLIQNNGLLSVTPSTQIAEQLDSLRAEGEHDIGMGYAIGTELRNNKLIHMKYDNGSYMNTGYQLSYSTLMGTKSSTSHVGR